MPVGEHADVVIAGSGFGGSVSADRFAEAGKRVVLLERGRRYAPGEFVRGPAEMSRNLWAPRAGLHGLFDVWAMGRDVADGAALPGPVGANPSLTIAALADRMCDRALGMPVGERGRPRSFGQLRTPEARNSPEPHPSAPGPTR